MTTPDPIRAALQRLLELEQRDWGTAGWGTDLALALAAARAALEAAPEPPPLLLAALVEGVAAAVTPAGGYEPGRGARDGAQMVNGEWWEPAFGCDSLGQTLDAIRARLVTAITGWCHQAIAARAALEAAPAVPEGYIDPEHQGEDRAMLEAYYEACRAEGGTADEITLRGLRAVLALPRPAIPAPAAGEVGDPTVAEIDAAWLACWSEETGRYDVVAFARAILARWGCPAIPTPPAGEVGELVSDLQDWADHYREAMGDEQTADRFARAAALLRQLSAAHAPQPVATPREEYHDDLGPVLWWRFPVEEPPYSGTPNDSDWPGYHTHFTPLPQTPCCPTTPPAGQEGPMAEPLSPAAQAVIDALDDRYELCGLAPTRQPEQCLAAALEALADQVAPVPDEYDPIPDGVQRQEWIRRDILQIAAELRRGQADG